MKRYEVELRRTSYVTMYVEANSHEQAEKLAWQELESDGSWGLSNANWELENITEGETNA